MRSQRDPNCTYGGTAVRGVAADGNGVFDNAWINTTTSYRLCRVCGDRCQGNVAIATMRC
jgi:hypothetical protein